MYVKIHRSGEREIVAVCDEDLLGKNFEEGKLNIKVSESFYKGAKKTKEEVKKILKNAGNINLVGSKSVTLAVEMGLINDRDIIKIKGVPYAIYFSF